MTDIVERLNDPGWLHDITLLQDAAAEIKWFKAERDKAWTRHLIEREELKAEKAALQTEIERLRELNDEQQDEIKRLTLLDQIGKRQLELLEKQNERLRSERHTTKEMLEDVLRKHGLGSTTPHYGLGRGGLK